MSARRELYVYYRVVEPQWREAAEAVATWQRALCRAQRGLEARLLRRPDVHEAAVTLMETYAGAATADSALQDEIKRGAPALRGWLIGERHLERFETLD